MKLSKGLAFFLGLILNIGGFIPSLAGGVTSYSGNLSTSGAAIATGVGNSATAAAQLEFRVGRFIVLGVYNTAGSNANPMFSTPANNFPGGFTFSALPGFITSEPNLSSKFELDGITSTTDQVTIIQAMNAASNTLSQDINIKGAVYSNLPISANMYVILSADAITLTGGTGAAPVYRFRGVAGVPGGAITSTTTPFTSPLNLANRRNSLGYARYTFIGDLDETSIDLNTDGSWTGSVTVNLNGL